MSSSTQALRTCCATLAFLQTGHHSSRSVSAHVTGAHFACVFFPQFLAHSEIHMALSSCIAPGLLAPREAHQHNITGSVSVVIATIVFCPRPSRHQSVANPGRVRPDHTFRHTKRSVIGIIGITANTGTPLSASLCHGFSRRCSSSTPFSSEHSNTPIGVTPLLFVFFSQQNKFIKACCL